eukprot:10517177-Alexandrium_andersonii.AAC.1
MCWRPRRHLDQVVSLALVPCCFPTQRHVAQQVSPHRPRSKMHSSRRGHESGMPGVAGGWTGKEAHRGKR